MNQPQPTFQTIVAALRSARHNSDCISLATQAISLAVSVDDIYTIIGIVRPRFPENDPAIVPLLTSARTKRNALVPIDNLPPEVLIKIFHFAASEKKLAPQTKAISDPDHIQHLVRLSAVCCLWKDVVNASPGLWSFLSADLTSPTALQMAIQKSQNTPVTITLGRNSMSTGTFFDMVSPVMHRCRVLCLRMHWHFRTRGNSVKLNNLIRQPSPLLEELYLDAEFGSRNTGLATTNDEAGVSFEPRRTTVDIWVLQNRPENLKVLSLQYLDWTWNQTAFPFLQDLRLSMVTISATELINCLDRAPQLQSLMICLLTDDGLGVTQPPGQTVTLPFLTRIQIDSAGLLTCTKSSPASSLHRWSSSFCPSQPSLPAPFTATSPHYFDLFHSLATANMTNSATISIQWSAQLFVVQEVEGSRKIKLEGFALRTFREKGQFARWLSGLWTHVESPSPITLLLGWVAPDERRHMELETEVIGPYLALDNVTELRIGAAVSRIRVLFSRLCIPVLNGDNVARWVFPRLQALELVGQPEAAGWLIRMWEVRNKAIQDWEATQPLEWAGVAQMVPPPLPLRVLRIVRSDAGRGQEERAETDRLRQAIGDAHFIEEIDPTMELD